jgi:hypothetical protein
MSQNPYSPPTAPVADLPTAKAGDNRDVLNACKLLWLSCAMDVMSPLLGGAANAAPPVGGMVGVLVSDAIQVLVTYWIVSKLKAGRNWMRLLLTIGIAAAYLLILILWAFYDASVFPTYAHHPVSAAIAVLEAILVLCYIALLNTPSARAWFASSKRAAPAA